MKSTTFIRKHEHKKPSPQKEESHYKKELQLQNQVHKMITKSLQNRSPVKDMEAKSVKDLARENYEEALITSIKIFVSL